MIVSELPMLALLHAILLVGGIVLDFLWTGSDRRGQRAAWTLWWAVVLTALVATAPRLFLDGDWQNPIYLRIAADEWLLGDHWTAAVSIMALLASAAGLFAGARPAHALWAGGAAGMMSGPLPFWLKVVPLAGLLGLKLRDRGAVSLHWRDEQLRLVVVAGVSIAIGLVLTGASSAIDRAISAPWREVIGVVLLVAGLGGLIGWFPFPNVRRIAYSIPDGDQSATEPGRASIGDAVARVLLPYLAAASLLARELVRLQTEAALAVLVVAIALPMIIAGARLLSEEHLADRLALQAVVLIGSLTACMPLAIWRGALESKVQQLDLWRTVNLFDAGQLWVRGMLAETGSWLMAAGGALLLTAVGSSDQFVSGLHGELRRRPRRGIWLAIGLWLVAGLPPSPSFWWRINLLASLNVTHQRSSLTNLFEPAPAFWVLTAGLLTAWIMAAIGWLMLAGRMIWSEPLRSTHCPAPRCGAWLIWMTALLATFLSTCFGPPAGN